MYLTQPVREQLVNALVRELNPMRIYLFGSFATQSARETSDVDVCVIVSDGNLNGSIYQKTVRAYQSLRNFPFAKDILVREQTQFDERSKWMSSIESEVKNKGLLLYSVSDE